VADGGGVLALTRFRSSRAVLLSVTLALGPAGALAQTAKEASDSSGDVARARDLFREATRLESQGKWPEAEDRLRQAIQVKETPGLRYHLAFCLEEQGKLVEALAGYDRARELITQGTPAPDVEKLLEPARERVLSRIAHLKVLLAQQIPGAKLLIDDRESPLAEEVLLDPGAHRVELRAPGHDSFITDVDLFPGEDRILQGQPARRAPTAPAAPSSAPLVEARSTERDRPESSSGRTFALIGAAGVTAVGVGVGVWGLLLRTDAHDRASTADRRLATGGDDACNPPIGDAVRYCADLHEAGDDAQTGATIATTGFVIAGVGAATFAATWLLWPSPHAARLELRPLGSGGFGAISGAF
jgi:hypothetical protein